MSEFLAEAQILIQANTVAFRAELAAALATVPKEITIPIVAVAPTGAAAATAATQAAGAAAQEAAAQTAAAAGTSTAAIEKQTSAMRVAGATTQQLTATQIEAAQINRLFAATEEALAKARLDVVGAASAEQAAEIRLSRETAAGAAARELLTEAQLRGLNVERLLANQTVAASLAMGEQAAAATADAAALEREATAAQHAAVAQTNLARGAATSALAAAGLRGATLTANASFIAGAASAIAFGKAVQTAANFETSLNVFRVTAQATADQMGRVSEAARQLGKDVTLPGVSAQDAADAMTNLAKAGLSVQDSIDGARGVLQLATAAQIDNAEATELTANALNAFGLSGKQAVSVADILANASVQAQGSIEDMGLALSQSSAVARQVGVSINDTAALITLLAKNGVRGSDAGTALRTAFLRLIKPTKDAQEQINKLGLSIRDAQGNVRADVFAQFGQATRGLSASQRDFAAATIFGQDAIRALAILAREGSAGLNQMRDAVQQQGTAAELAAAQNTGLEGAINNLKNQLDGAALSAGELAIGPLTALVGIFADNVQAAQEFTETLERIPTDIATTVHLDFIFGGGEGDQGQQSAISSFFDKVRDNIREGAGKALTSTVIERAVPGGQRTIDILNALFPPEETKKAGENAGANIRSAIEDASRQAVVEANSAGPKITSALNQMFSLVDTALQQGINKARRGVFAAIQAATGQQAGLDEVFNQLTAGGASPQQLIANLKKQAETQQRIIAAAGPQAVGAALEKRRAAVAKLAQINTQIGSLQNQILSKQEQQDNDRQQKAEEAAKARSQADQDFLDALQGGRRPIERRITRADATETLADDIKRQQQLRQRILGEIVAVTKRDFEDAKDKASALADLRDQLNDVTTKIGTLQGEQAANLAQVVEDKFNLRVSIAQSSGNGQALIRLFDQRIHDLEVAIGKAKDESKKELELKDQLAQTRADRESALSDLEEKRIRLAELRGNEGAELGFINARIARLKKAIAAAKREHRATLDLQIELAETQKQKDDLLDKAEEDQKKSTTAFDLLKQAAETFQQNAGNLINAQQPFVGPSGFSADIAQFLIRRQTPQAPTTTGRTVVTPSVPPVQLQDQPLIQAIEKLTDAVINAAGGSANTSTVTGTRQSRTWHAENMMARRFQEA